MVKLTPDLILGAGQYTNPVKDRELDLRGYKIPTIENLGATLDQFDTIDFSDNEVRKVENFPLLPRLKNLMFNNNRILRIGDDVYESLPNLRSCIFTNNNIQELADIENLAKCKGVNMLSFLHNPVTSKPNYRLFVIHKFPQLRVLDFRKVKQKERDECKQLFKSKEGKDQLKEIKKRAKTFVVPGDTEAAKATGINSSGLTPDQVRNIKAAISKASTLDEIERLNQMLRTGVIPGQEQQQQAQNGDQVVEMDED